MRLKIAGAGLNNQPSLTVSFDMRLSADAPVKEMATIPFEERNGVVGWPSGIQDIVYMSSADQTMQPTLFYKPKGDEAVPLLMALHTWSNSYLDPESPYAEWCVAKGWVFVHPHFRGTNNRPEACGSDLVVQDIISAVDYAKKNANVDPNRIYLVGVSGGGHLAMLLAGRAPHLWAGVSAWCGILDLTEWYAESVTRKTTYPDMIAKSCGGLPGTNFEVNVQ